MPDFQLLPGALGMDMPDGRKIQADRRGRVRVDDQTARAIVGSAAYRRYDAMIPLAAGRFYPPADSFVCGCGFSPWPWQDTCPRCGTTFKSEAS
jgi:hypothetical protein